MLCLIPATYFCINIFLKIKLRGKNIYKVLRQVSILIYPIHSLVSGINLGNSLLNYFVMMGVTVLIALLILKLSRKISLFRLLY